MAWGVVGEVVEVVGVAEEVCSKSSVVEVCSAVLCVVVLCGRETHEEHFFLSFSFRGRDTLAHPSLLSSPLHTSQSLVEEGTGTELIISYSSLPPARSPLLSHHPSNPELRT
jgi:hypothetical protein